MKLKVLMIPGDHEYVRGLTRALHAQGVQVRHLMPFHYAAPLNILLMLYYRLRGFKLIHVHWLYVFPFNFGMKIVSAYAKILGYRMIWEVHNIVAHKGTKRDIACSKWFYDFADGLIFHSRADEERTKTMLAVFEKTHKAFAYHSNFIGSYPNTMSREEARSLLRIEPGEKVLLCFGQIRKNRGYGHLLKAIETLDDTVLLIAGEVKDAELYKELSKNADGKKMRLFGKWIKGEELETFFNACDLVVLPYTEITTSGVVPLAYSFSRPVVVSGIGGIKEMVPPEIGALCLPGDSDSIREAVLEVLARDTEEMGRKAYAFAKEKLSWEKAAIETKRLYKELNV